MFTFKITTNAVKGLKKALSDIDSRLSRNLREKLLESAEYLKTKIAENAPEQNGNLKRRILSLPVSTKGYRNISVSATSSRKVILEINLSKRADRIINWVNDGTGIYGPYKTEIVPVKSKFLVFDIEGETFIRRSVLGQRGQHFIEKGVSNARLGVYSKIRSALKG